MNSQDPMIDNNDPRLTAYALGELAPAEVAQIEAALKSSPELQAVVADIRRASETISNVFLSEPSLQLTPEQKSQLLTEAESASNFDVRSNNISSVNRAAANATPAVASEYYQPSSASSAGWLNIAVAAGLASVLIGGAYYFSQAPRQSMTAADLSQSEAESLDGSIEQSDEKIDSLQTPPAVREKNIGEFDLAKIGKAAPPTPRAERLSNPLIKPKRPNEAAAELADAARDSKYKLQSKMLPSKRGEADATPSGFLGEAKSAAKSDFAAKSKDWVNKTPKISQPLPAAFNAMPGTTKANPNTLTLAQQALDQSILGSLSLTVVAQSLRADLGGAGARLRPSLPSSTSQQRLPIAPPIANSPAQKPLANKKTKRNLPATFALQISDQNAKQTVELWASYADPEQQRKLSFNDLIGASALPAFAKKMKPGALQPNRGLDDYDDDYGDASSDQDDASEGKPFFANEMPSLASATPTQQLAAATLAKKLREFIDRPSPTARGNAQLYYSDSPAIVAAELFRENNYHGQISEDSADKPSLNGVMEGVQLNKSGENDMFEMPQTDAAPKSGRKRQLLRQFDFDYSQVIEQLKLKLKIRNQSVSGLK